MKLLVLVLIVACGRGPAPCKPQAVGAGGQTQSRRCAVPRNGIAIPTEGTE